MITGFWGTFSVMITDKETNFTDPEDKITDSKLMKGALRTWLGVLSHHRKCEMKSPHLVDFNWDFVNFQPNLSQILADFSRD